MHSFKDRTLNSRTNQFKQLVAAVGFRILLVLRGRIEADIELKNIGLLLQFRHMKAGLAPHPALFRHFELTWFLNGQFSRIIVVHLFLMQIAVKIS